MIDVGEVTSWLLTQLDGADFLVGDGEAPLDGGWSEGQPNTGAFVEYLVLKQAPAVVPAVDGVSLCDSSSKWLRIPYQLVSYQTSRPAADALGAAARTLLSGLEGRVECGDLMVSAHQVQITSVQGAARDDSTYPKFWSSVTNFTMIVARV